MCKGIQAFLRGVAISTAAIYFLTNVVWAHSTESNLWTQRRRHVAKSQAGTSDNLLLASLPTLSSSLALLHSLPSASKTTSALSEELAKTLPAGFAAKHAALFNALHTTHGTIRKVWLPMTNVGDRVVVHIQDVHQNEDAQRRIGGAVAALVQAKQTSLVALEGAFAPIDVKAYHDFEDREVVGLTADCLLRKNLITGPVHTFMTTKAPLPILVGVDDKAHYDANVDAYRRSAPKIEGYKKEISAQKRELDRIKKAVFSADLLAFDTVVGAYKEERASLAEYVAALAPEMGVGQTGLLAQALKMEKELDFDKVEQDRKELIEVLVKNLSKPQIDQLIQESAAYRTGEVRYGAFYRYLQTLCHAAKVELPQFPRMDAYIRYVMLSDRIDGEKLMDEMATLEKARYGELAKTTEEKDLVEKSNKLHLTGRLLNFALTPVEWAEYKALKSSKISSPFLDLTSFEAFYQEAHARDGDLAQNLLSSMEKGNIKQAVLVTGGYHTEGVSERLREAGVTVVTFTPRIEKVDTAQGSAYMSIFTQEKTPLEKLFAGEKLFVSQLVAADSVVGKGGVGMQIVVALEALKGASSQAIDGTLRFFGANPARFKVSVNNAVATVKTWGEDARAAVQTTVQRAADGQLVFTETVAAASAVLLVAMALFPSTQMALVGLVTAALSALLSTPLVSLITAAPAFLASAFPALASTFQTVVPGLPTVVLSPDAMRSLANLATVAMGLTLLTPWLTRGRQRWARAGSERDSASMIQQVDWKRMFVRSTTLLAAGLALYFLLVSQTGAVTLEEVGSPSFRWGWTLVIGSGFAVLIFAIFKGLKKPRWLRVIFLSASLLMAALVMPVSYMYDKYDYWIAERSGRDHQGVRQNPPSLIQTSSPGIDLAEYPWISHYQKLGKNSDVASALSVVSSGLWDDIPSELRYAREAKKAKERHIPLSGVPLVARFRQIPRTYVEWVKTSAQTHRIPPEVLMAAMYYSPASSYSIEMGLRMIGKRITSVSGITRSLTGILPRSVMEVKIESKLLDIVGGVYLGTQNTMGIYQVRPIMVRHFLKELGGRPVSEMSNREISLSLLDPQTNIEAFAAIYRAVIDDVEKHREMACEGKDPLVDLHILLKGAKEESKSYNVWAPTQARFAEIPSRLLMGENDWILAIYHPLYGTKFMPKLNAMNYST